MNTRFEKQSKAYCTFHEPKAKGFKAPWGPKNYKMLDLLLCSHRWKNSVKDVESRPDIGFNSVSQFRSTHMITKFIM